jgi:DNA-binding FrmR family transcriptional regulator
MPQTNPPGRRPASGAASDALELRHEQGSGDPGYAADKADVLRRLARIEGQIRGINKMVETDTYCIEVLTQISAATRALQSVALRLLDEHMQHCLVDAVRAGGQAQQAKLAEASAAVARLVRS